jgi:hypothetical protein
MSGLAEFILAGPFKKINAERKGVRRRESRVLILNPVVDCLFRPVLIDNNISYYLTLTFRVKALRGLSSHTRSCRFDLEWDVPPTTPTEIQAPPGKLEGDATRQVNTWKLIWQSAYLASLLDTLTRQGLRIRYQARQSEI